MGIYIIGIDCAVQDKNVGLALASFDGHEARIEQVPGERKEVSVAKIVTDWINSYPPALLALDAPLGWPIGLRNALQDHEAGKPIKLESDSIFKKEKNAMFRRTTDEFVINELKMRLLDVGANLIARTAYDALERLDKLRTTNRAIPLAWEPGPLSHTCAIEVYPAGTLKAHGIEIPKEKRKDRNARRQLILDELSMKHFKLPSDKPSREFLEKNDHALDAVICALAGVDFLRGEVFEPKDAEVAWEIAEKEGWIWVWDSSKAQRRS